MKVSKVNREAGAFDVDTLPNRGAVDDVWDYYEPQITESVTALEHSRAQHLPRDLMLRGLIPLIAGVFVRSFGWDLWYDRLMASQREALHPDHKGIARLADWRRFAGALMRCNWTVLHAPASARFIANDVGFSVGQLPDSQWFAFVPLGPQMGLQIRRTPLEPRLWNEVVGGRMALLGRWDTTEEQRVVVNRHVAEDALRELYGAEESDVMATHIPPGQERIPCMASVAIMEYPKDSDSPPEHDWFNELRRAGLSEPPIPAFDDQAE